jgi:hypothetical protein
VGDGDDGFGPPRWIDDNTLVAKPGRYDAQGVIASIPDVVTVDGALGAIEVLDRLPLRSWDPDPTTDSGCDERTSVGCGRGVDGPHDRRRVHAVRRVTNDHVEH